MLVHGPSKSGKSWLGDTTPGPRLVLDAEAGSRFTPSRKKEWDPNREAPPTQDGTWDTALVSVRDYQTVKAAMEWLTSGQHPFKSVVLDSISEIQQRCVDSLVGINPMQTQDWGTLLRDVGNLVRKFRDLLVHPTNPLEGVLIIAMTTDNNGQAAPFVQGQLKTMIPYFADVIGYIAPQADDAGTLHRYLMLTPDTRWVSGERVGGKLPTYIELQLGQPTFTGMLDAVFGPAELPPDISATQDTDTHPKMSEDRS